MHNSDDIVATPFLPERVNEIPYGGYDCSCKEPSVYRQVIDDRGKPTIFSLCPICDNIPERADARDWGNTLGDH